LARLLNQRELTKDGFGTSDQLKIQFFAEFPFTFEELEQYFVINCVLGEELFSRKRALVGQGNGVDLAVFCRVFELHKKNI
jgi:hypothetical protein